MRISNARKGAIATDALDVGMYRWYGGLALFCQKPRQAIDL